MCNLAKKAETDLEYRVLVLHVRDASRPRIYTLVEPWVRIVCPRWPFSIFKLARSQPNVAEWAA